MRLLFLLDNTKMIMFKYTVRFKLLYLLDNTEDELVEIAEYFLVAIQLNTNVKGFHPGQILQ